MKSTTRNIIDASVPLIGVEIKKRLERRMEMVASDMWLNLNKNVLAFFTKKDVKVLPEKEALQSRDLKGLHAPERMFMKLERAISKRTRWRSG